MSPRILPSVEVDGVRLGAGKSRTSGSRMYMDEQILVVAEKARAERELLTGEGHISDAWLRKTTVFYRDGYAAGSVGVGALSATQARK